MKILFVGLSNKINKEPFDKTTNSGEVIHQIINKTGHECYLINLVQFAPLDKNGKLRYPKRSEIKQEIPKFIEYINKLNPDLIIGFGKIVERELGQIDIKNKNIIFKVHPSYICVYKRKLLDIYIDDVVESIEKNLQHRN
jgi:uncharacterized membrane protein YcaP (DUF421 family)